jgi:hypothetical protein
MFPLYSTRISGRARNPRPQLRLRQQLLRSGGWSGTSEDGVGVWLSWRFILVSASEVQLCEFMLRGMVFECVL